MFEKFTGYFMLIFGIVIIFFAAYNVYTVFTKKTQPVQLFAFSNIEIETNQLINTEGVVNDQSVPEEFVETIKKQIQPQKTEILKGDVLSQPLNIFAHVVFWGFISSVGFKIAQLGAIMVRPAKVELKEQTIRQVANAIKVPQTPSKT